MNKSVIVIAGVLVVVVAASVLVLFAPRKGKEAAVSTPEAPAPAEETAPPAAEAYLPPKLIDLEAREIDGVHVMTFRDEYNLSRMSGRFILSGLMEIDAVDQDAVSAFIGTLASLEPVAVIDSEIPDEAVGLGNYSVLRITDDQGAGYELRLGDAVLTNSTRAAVVFREGRQDGPRYRIPGSQYERMMATRQDLMK